MVITKISHKNNNTFVTLRSEKEWCVITLHGFVEVSMNKKGTALSIGTELNFKES